MTPKKLSIPLLSLVIFFLVSGSGCYTTTQSDHPQPQAQALKTTEAPAAAHDEAQTYTLGSYSQTFTYAGTPRPTTYPNSITLLKSTSFLVGYDETRENPAWAAYRIPAATLAGTPPRPSRFKTDKRTTARVTHDDYTNTGYDRGHMAPNLAIASRFGKKAQAETFVMSNVVPQRGELNQGPWRLLEATLADRTAPAEGEIWVVTGPIYDDQPDFLKAGNEIPDAFFMAIADETPTGPRLQAFIMPQSTPRRADYRAYKTTVDDIEQQTGLDLFADLPDVIEGVLEAEKTRYWLE